MTKLAKRRRKLCEIICADELVPSDVQENIHQAFCGRNITYRGWEKPPGKPRYFRCRDRVRHTPYGRLEIRLEGGWQAFRNGVPLVHSGCRNYGGRREPAVFLDDDVAKGAALFHLFDGWGLPFDLIAKPPQPDGLLFWDDPPVPLAEPRQVFASDLNDTRLHRVDEELRALDLDPSQCDEPELRELVRPWGRPVTQELRKICDNAYDNVWGIPFEKQLDCLDLPEWQRRAQGWYELQTPHGPLVVRRQVGWIIEVGAAALRYADPGPKVVCNHLRDAQILALMYAGKNDGPLFWKQPDDPVECAGAGESPESALV
jgi:hypothetical protein